jgi:5-methylcytosine-specific restriction endonuclease McrA
MADLKTCLKCGPRPTSEFHKDSSKSDGLYPVCKACRKPLTAASYVKNHDSVRSKQKAAYHADPEKHRAASKEFRESHHEYFVHYLREYYATNKEALSVKGKVRYWSHPEKHRAASRSYREANPEKVREGVRDWFRRHPHAPRLAANKRRASWARVEDTLTTEQLGEILEYFNHRCGYCLVDLRTLPSRFRTFDHIIAIKRGGSNTQDNVIPCCKSCNSRKKDRPIFRMVQYLSPRQQSIDASVGSRSEITSQGNG